MTYTPKPGDGSLFPNDRKNSDKSPDMTGYVLAHRDIRAGEKLNLAAWQKGSGDGFLSLRMSDVRGKEGEPKRQPARQTRQELDDEIPF